MSAFTYKATTREGKVVEGQIEAENERAVLVKLQDLGYLPLRITAGPKAARPVRARRIGPPPRKVRPRICCCSPRS